MLELSDKLREFGVDAEIDRYHTRPPQGWPLWCDECLRPENSKYVLTICTPTYRDRVENKAPADEGRGVYWEGSVVYQYIYDEKINKRFIPILLGDEPAESIPFRLKGYTNYAVRQFDLKDTGFEALYRELTNQPPVVKRVLGVKVLLGPRSSGAPVASAPLPERPALSTFEPPSPPQKEIPTNPPWWSHAVNFVVFEHRRSVIMTRAVIATISLLIGLPLYFSTLSFGWGTDSTWFIGATGICIIGNIIISRIKINNVTDYVKALFVSALALFFLRYLFNYLNYTSWWPLDVQMRDSILLFLYGVFLPSAISVLIGKVIPISKQKEN